MKPFVSKDNWKGTTCPLGKKTKKFDKNNPKIALNVLYVKNEYISYLRFKNQLNYKNKIIILLIPNGEG